MKIMEDPSYSKRERQIECKNKELLILKNRLERYWKKLTLEALSIAKKKGIRSEIIDLENLGAEVFADPSSNKIQIYKDGENVNVDSLLKLAKPRFPTLYRRYVQMKTKYEYGLIDLEKMVRNAQDQ